MRQRWRASGCESLWLAVFIGNGQDVTRQRQKIVLSRGIHSAQCASMLQNLIGMNCDTTFAGKMEDMKFWPGRRSRTEQKQTRRHLSATPAEEFEA